TATMNGGTSSERLKAIKAFIRENLGSPDLTVTEVARRQHISPRYIHMLFAKDGATFSEFLVGERIARAHRMLSDRRFDGLSISTIAFEVGFGDLSYFNRKFRKRFGITPSGLRHSVTTQSLQLQNKAEKNVRIAASSEDQHGRLVYSG